MEPSDKFDFGWDEDTSIATAVHQALGAASVCWFPKPEGLFLPDLALGIGGQLMEFLKSRLQCDCNEELEDEGNTQ